MSPGIVVSTSGARRTVRLARAGRGNRLDLADLADLRAVLAAAPVGAERMVAIEGEGDDFCLGREPGPTRGDGTGSPSLDLAEGLARPILEVYAAIRSSPLPVVSLVRGRALGLGCALAGTCDVTLASDDARFSLPELDKDLPPTLAVTGLLGRVTPKAIGELVLSRREVDAAEARSLGLVSRVLARDHLEAAASELERSLAGNSVRALATLKRFLAVTAYAAQPASGDLAAEMIGAALAEARR